MKSVPVLLGLLSSGVNAAQNAYAPTAAPAQPAYDPYAQQQAYAQPAYDPYAQQYGYANPQPASGYAPQYSNEYGGEYIAPNQPLQNYGYKPFYPEEEKISHGYDQTYPTKPKPAPFVNVKPADELDIMHIDSLHCFQTGSAPWTNCGGRPLYSYFLEQCLGFYFSVTSGVEGICKGSAPAVAPAQPAYVQPAQPAYNQYGYAQPGYAQPTPAPYTAAPTTAPFSSYTSASSLDYQVEKCLQSTYTSITLATVMCLTENMIRIQYIEHYADIAKTNPIEGPILYLRKLHQFINEVIDCNPESVGNYPTLWTTFRDGHRVAYNPNAPYIVTEMGPFSTVGLPDCVDEDASGWAQMVSGDRFVCNNIDDLNLNSGIYKRDVGNPFYMEINSCSSAAWSISNGNSGFYQKKCTRTKKPNNSPSSPTPGPLSNPANSNRLTLRGLYDGVNPFTRNSTATIRVRSIAEHAANNAGVLGQPILEGHGIIYFCAFYACKANNNGKTEGTCFPEYDSAFDWSYIGSGTSIEELNELSANVQKCVDDKWITKEMVMSEVQNLQEHLNQRTHICMAENDIVNGNFNGNLNPSGDAFELIFLRRLMHEKCYLEKTHDCLSPNEEYRWLKRRLEDLNELCTSFQMKYADEYNKYHSTAPTQQPYNYQWQNPNPTAAPRP